MKDLIELTPKQMQDLEELSKLLFTEDEIIISMQLNREEAELDFKNRNSSIFNTYHKGRLTTIAKHRKGVIAMAEAGSSPAQSMVEKLIVNTERNMVQ